MRGKQNYSHRQSSHKIKHTILRLLILSKMMQEENAKEAVTRDQLLSLTSPQTRFFTGVIGEHSNNAGKFTAPLAKDMQATTTIYKSL
ncbi:hypothetical protein N7495_003857 [Penicillium taxi]|uniref:uncharacterized protein n=1 Tax=Penicillium taxi TaxID=168475 RepID=UPI0025457BA2|nr:uncharacterized protein N7495_003857 [Penicillium taxi]KAJ5899113.1 hypothetical protein N7495_003857 [Penicillium taxi]